MADNYYGYTAEQWSHIPPGEQENIKDMYLLEHPSESMQEGTVLDKAKMFVMEVGNKAKDGFAKFKTTGFYSSVSAAGKYVVDFALEKLDPEAHQSYKDRGIVQDGQGILEAIKSVKQDVQQQYIAEYEALHPSESSGQQYDDKGYPLNTQLV